MKGYFMNQLFPECIGCCTTTCGSTYNVINYYCHSFDILLCFLDVVAKPTSIIAQEVFVLLLSKDFYSTASSRGLLCWSYNKTPSACTEGVPIPIIWVMGNRGGRIGETNTPTANTGVIRITGRGISAELPQDISPELLTALLKGLSSCWRKRDLSRCT